MTGKETEINFIDCSFEEIAEPLNEKREWGSKADERFGILESIVLETARKHFNDSEMKMLSSNKHFWSFIIRGTNNEVVKAFATYGDLDEAQRTADEIRFMAERDIALMMSMFHKGFVKILGEGIMSPAELGLDEMVSRGAVARLIPFYKMEDVGEYNLNTLRKMISRKYVTMPQAMGVFRKIAESLRFKHEYYIIHRDLKPENILLTRNLEPRIIDFGAFAESYKHDDVNWMTPPYISQEQARMALSSNEKRKSIAFTPKTDVQQLGMIMADIMLSDSLQNPVDTIHGLYEQNNFALLRRLASGWHPRYPRTGNEAFDYLIQQCTKSEGGFTTMGPVASMLKALEQPLDYEKVNAFFSWNEQKMSKYLVQRTREVMPQDIENYSKINTTKTVR